MRSPRYQAAELLRRGLSPSQISREMRIPLGAVMAYLYRLVGEGELRRSDILFALDPRARQEIEKIVQQRGTIHAGRIRRWLHAAGIQVDRDDLNLYLKLRDARVDLGDMYELVRDLELSLHRFVRESLVRQYGEQDWWREGVPLGVREDCALMNERDPEPATELFCYTSVMNLVFTIDKQWTVLAPALPPKLRANKQDFLARLKRLNAIRNMVMHPVKGYTITEEDFDFLRALHVDFAPAVNATPESTRPPVAEEYAA
jgi:hypothetical protein